MASGTIVKALSGYYYVNVEGKIWQCRGRGILRKKGESPLVGDHVDISYSDHDEGSVDVIHPRKNELVRPPIANVDAAILVTSVAEPAFSANLLDKFLVHTERAGLETIICLTKTELCKTPNEIKAIRDIYEPIGYTVVVTSAKKSVGISELLAMLEGKMSVFAGQSGVGKSSMLNAMLPNLQLETNEISMKLGRGRHTTRHVELMALPGSGFVADTPGFSQLEFTGIEPEELTHYFVEMKEAGEGCKFRGCTHEKEPSCAVKLAVEEGRIAASRYDNYLLFLAEVKELKRRLYR